MLTNQPTCGIDLQPSPWGAMYTKDLLDGDAMTCLFLFPIDEIKTNLLLVSVKEIWRTDTVIKIQGKSMTCNPEGGPIISLKVTCPSCLDQNPLCYPYNYSSNPNGMLETCFYHCFQVYGNVEFISVHFLERNQNLEVCEIAWRYM